MATAALAQSDGSKLFTCSQQGCNKAFARREHLHRHEFNHKDSDFTCLRCSAHFRRRDLLERHKLRHRQKDDEAGGEGLGHLATRKRLWRDRNGEIINSSRRNKNTSHAVRANRTNENEYSINSNTALPSPPTSSSSSTLGTTRLEPEHDVDLGQASWQQIDFGLVTPTEELEFLSTSSWTDQSLQPLVRGPCDLPYNEFSYADTTITFNTSLPTAGYYQYLFGTDFGHNGSVYEHETHPRNSEHEISNSAEAHFSGFHASPSTSAVLPSNTPSTAFHASPNCGTVQSCEQTSPRNHDTNTQNLVCETDSNGNDSLQTTTHADDNGFASCQNLMSSNMHSTFGLIELDNTSHYFKSSNQPTSSTASEARTSSEAIFPPDASIRSIPARLPAITDDGRDKLMQLIFQTRPTKPDKSEITSCDPSLSLPSLQRYSDLFFSKFNSTYPLVHAPTFNASTAHPLHLMSIILLGATYADKSAHLLAVCIHDVMRPMIHSHKDFGPRPPLWMLQTILLVECFGKTRAGERQHDMSNMYHGLQINLLRRSDCLSAYVPPWDGATTSLNDYWHLAVEAEEKRRLAMISFMWDTQHAIFFAQILCMNASELKLTLPWDPSIWEAETAEEWLQLTKAASPSSQFLTVLQSYTDSSAPLPPTHLNALSRVLVLHGLISLSWDFRRRDQTALNRSMLSAGPRWQCRVSKCYLKWHEDFEHYTKEVLTALSASPTKHAEFQRFAVASSAIYHTAQLILEVETADLQIHAKAKHIMGRPLNGMDRQRSQARLNEVMIRNDRHDLGKAVWHAARLLRDGIRKLDNWNVDETIHFPWCLYLATLACWTLHSLATGDTADRTPKPSVGKTKNSDDEDGDWDARTDMMAFISALTRLNPASSTFSVDIWAVAGKYRPYGLVRCMKKHLSTVRWAVIREAVVVLSNLLDAEPVQS